MKKKAWILLAIAVLLIAWRWRRERFEATATIKKPEDLTATEVARIKGLVTPASTLPDDEVKRVIGGFWSYAVPSRIAGEAATQKGWSVETNRITTADLDTYLTTKEASASTEKRRQYKDLLQAYYIDQGQSVFQAAAGYTGPTGSTGSTGSTGATGSTGTIERPSSADSRLQQEIATTASIPLNNTVQIGYFLAQVQKFYDTVYLPAKQRPTNAQFTSFADSVDTSSYPAAIKNNFKDHLVEILETYFATARETADQGPVGGPTGGVGAQMGATAPTGPPAPVSPGVASSSSSMSGGGTGGSAQPRLQGFQLFGPQFAEYGAPLSASAMNRGTANGGGAGQYPELLGGREKPGTGATGPVLPPSSSLGTDLGSMFFPGSRTPGDMDLVPDPFRAMNNFSLASYTPKTDPVPFLPDFSAFQS